MTVYDFITKHPDKHIRIIRYTPAPDIMDEHGQLVCGGEGDSEVVFDSTTGEGDLQTYLLNEITAENEGDDGVTELEFIPDRYWQLW